jgi:hypothetical protein
MTTYYLNSKTEGLPDAPALPTRLDDADRELAIMLGTQHGGMMRSFTTLTECIYIVDRALAACDRWFPEEVRPLAYQAMFNAMKDNLEARGLRFWLDNPTTGRLQPIQFTLDR